MIEVPLNRVQPSCNLCFYWIIRLDVRSGQPVLPVPQKTPALLNALQIRQEGKPDMVTRVNSQVDSTATGAIALADGSVFLGRGTGAVGVAAGELCFNTAMTGYQEVLTDPSYAGQFVLFTFPHIGNVGANADDREYATEPASKGARAALFRDPIT
ncbi:MAG: carbamoyl-phosphate synthase domain-containing protein, partial [Pseudomonadota bacterium]